MLRSPQADGRRGAPARRVAIAVALLVAALSAVPADVDAATRTMVAACGGVNLRTAAATRAASKVRLAVGTPVTVVGTVNGASWSATCGGTKSGKTWARITAVNGKPVKARYGVNYLYAATGVLAMPRPAAPPSPPTADPPPPTTTTSATPDDVLGGELMRLVNLDRVALGLAPYPVDPGLVAIARDAPFACPTDPSLVLRGRAADMADRSHFGHVVAGCYLAGTRTPYPALEIVRTVFGYAQARSEILHWNSYGSAPATYKAGCDINGSGCRGETTAVPYTVALAQRSFMSSTPHRTAELASYERFGCGSATVPGTTRTYFACLFADGGSAWSPGAAAAPPVPGPTPAPTPAPTPEPVPGVAAAPQPMMAACSGANLRTAATTSAPVAASLAAGAAVTVVATVAGAAWSTSCPGPTSGSTWYQVSEVGGVPVGALYGVPALYAATGVLAAGQAQAIQPAAAPAPAGASLPAVVTLFGRGAGHGVGLSQYGARGRALAGQDAAAILAHYYPGTMIGAISPDASIRVLLLDDAAPSAAAPLLVVGRGGPWTVDGVAATFPAGAGLRLSPAGTGAGSGWRAVVDDGSGTVLLDAALPADLRVRPAAAATTLQLAAGAAAGNEYRGALRMILAGARADVVNELPLESYLRGVVPAEMPSTWPAAARMAQAIAARSYAAYRRQPPTATFDVYDDTRSQVYLGVRGETAAADAVVAATAGQVLLGGSGIANALYHSSDGGATEDNENVFVSAGGARTATPVAYLRGSPDRDPAGVPYDIAAPHAAWQTRSYSIAQLSAIFAADARTSVGTLLALDLADRGSSGRLVSVTLVGTSGSKKVSGSVFVAAFNAGRPAGDPPAWSTLLDLAPVP